MTGYFRRDSSTRSRISSPGLKYTTRRGGTLIGSPVFGLRPISALRGIVEKPPKPRISTRSLVAIASTNDWMMVLTARSTSLRSKRGCPSIRNFANICRCKSGLSPNVRNKTPASQTRNVTLAKSSSLIVLSVLPLTIIGLPSSLIQHGWQLPTTQPSWHTVN